MTTPNEDGRSPAPSGAPAITDALRAEARSHPGEWVYAIDPGFEGSGNVPPQGVVGAWQSDENGELSGDFVPNPNYLPTPQARGWHAPTTALERVLQLVLSGYLPDEALAGEVGQAEVFVFDRADGGIFVAPAEDGGQVVYAYTDPARAAATGYAEHRAVKGAELAAALPPDVRIALNAGSTCRRSSSPREFSGCDRESAERSCRSRRSRPGRLARLAIRPGKLGGGTHGRGDR